LATRTNWIVETRHQENLNALLKTDYSAAEIANVEHFFVAARSAARPRTALLEHVFNPAFAYATAAAWDLVYSPMKKIVEGQGVSEAYQYDSEQFFEFDVKGIRFGHALLPAVQEELKRTDRLKR
jgi:hypothetical protein